MLPWPMQTLAKARSLLPTRRIIRQQRGLSFAFLRAKPRVTLGPADRHQPRARSLWKTFLLYPYLLAITAHVTFGYFYVFAPAYGISMMPTMNSFGEWVFISKWYRRGRGVHVGDVISFRHPVHEGEDAVKRVVGLEGDFVLMNTPGKSEAMIQIPQGHCWVAGDNLLHSRDSRHFGPLPMALIRGKVTATVTFRNWRVPVFSTMTQGLSEAYLDDEIE